MFLRILFVTMAFQAASVQATVVYDRSSDQSDRVLTGQKPGRHVLAEAITCQTDHNPFRSSQSDLDSQKKQAAHRAE